MTGSLITPNRISSHDRGCRRFEEPENGHPRARAGHARVEPGIFGRL